MLICEVELVDRDRFRCVFTTPVQPSCAATVEVPAWRLACVTGTEPTGNGPRCTAHHYSENHDEEALPTSSLQSSGDKLTSGQYYWSSVHAAIGGGALSERESFVVEHSY